MLEIITLLIPTAVLIVFSFLIIDIYLLVRKYLKLKIEKLKKEN